MTSAKLENGVAVGGWDWMQLRIRLWSRSRTMHPMQSPPSTIGGMKESDDVEEWHLIPRWLLISILVTFREQLLKGLVSWGSTGEYLMIDYSLGDAFGVLSCPYYLIIVLFFSMVHDCRYFALSSVVWAVYLGVCLGVTFHIVNLWQHCVCSIRSVQPDALSLWWSTCTQWASAGYTRYVF